MTAPRIAISPNLMGPDRARRFYPNKHLFYGERSMAAAVYRAGGRPVLVPDLPAAAACEVLATCDGLLLAGGADVAPSTYGAEPILDGRFPGDPARDRLERALVESAIGRDMPVLGICRGHQILNVAFGGTLLQDIAVERPGSLVHRDQATYDRLHHGVHIDPRSRLAGLWEALPPAPIVNSIHHQAIDRPGDGLRVVATAEDGTIEAIEAVDPSRFVFGVQWHPEWMPWAPEDRNLLPAAPLFRAFVAAARGDATAAPVPTG